MTNEEILELFVSMKQQCLGIHKTLDKMSEELDHKEAIVLDTVEDVALYQLHAADSFNRAIRILNRIHKLEPLPYEE